MSVADGFLVRDRIPCPLSSPSAGTHQARTSAGPVYAASLCEFICVSVLLCAEGTVPTGQSYGVVFSSENSSSQMSLACVKLT